MKVLPLIAFKYRLLSFISGFSSIKFFHWFRVNGKSYVGFRVYFESNFKFRSVVSRSFQDSTRFLPLSMQLYFGVRMKTGGFYCRNEFMHYAL